MGKRGKKADPEIAPLLQRNLEAASTYYTKPVKDSAHTNDYFIQRKRVYKRMADSGKMPQQRTILKYKIEIVDGKVIIPADLDNKPTTVIYEKPKPQEVILKEAPQPIIKVGTITSVKAVNWLIANYTRANDRTKSTYTQLNSLLKESKLLKDP